MSKFVVIQAYTNGSPLTIEADRLDTSVYSANMLLLDKQGNIVAILSAENTLAVYKVENSP